MVIKKVQHFLNSEGLAYFPQWVDHLKQVMSVYQGIVLVSGLKMECYPDQTHLIMIFDSELSLNAWLQGEDHCDVLKDIKKYALKDWEIQTYDSI